MNYQSTQELLQRPKQNCYPIYDIYIIGQAIPPAREICSLRLKTNVKIHQSYTKRSIVDRLSKSYHS